MSSGEEARTDFLSIVDTHGTLCRFRYFTDSYPGAGSDYDDAPTLTQSGTDFWIKGVVQPTTRGATVNSVSPVKQLQGREAEFDSVLYVDPTIDTDTIFKVRIGSPGDNDFAIIPAGVNRWEEGGVTVYKKLFLRHLTTGSLIGE